MASHVVVIATDLRRTTIKVNPGTYLIDVLEEACKKLNLSSDKYLIKHRQKQVDLSVPFRTSGLIPGAKLELVQKSNTPSAIQVGLQLPQPEASEIPGGRLVQKFPSDIPIWKILRQFESGKASNGKNINITARGVAQTTSGTGSGGGQLYYESPVLNIMGRELSTFADFQKTLSQLGYNSGSVLIRLSYRKTDQTLYDAMTEMSNFFKEIGDEDNQEDAPGSTAEQPTVESSLDSTKDPADVPMTEAQPEASEGSKESKEPVVEQRQHPESAGEQAQADLMEFDNADKSDPLKPVNVFLAPTNETPAAALQPVDESDFAPSIAHAQLHQARLQENSRNKRLLSDKELEEKAAAEAARIASIKSVLVKVRFPDNTSSDWQVGPAETGRFLYDAVRHVMANSDQPFHLVLPGTKTIIKDDPSPNNSLIKTYKLSGRILVNLVWNDNVPPAVRKQPFLKANVAQQGQQVKVPEPAVQDDKDNDIVVQQIQKPDKSDSGGDKLGKKLPKWFKMGKK